MELCEILPGVYFCWVVRTWQGVFLTIGTFFKAKNSILCILNILNIFPGGGKGISKFLASVWRLPFIPLVRKTLQFLPNLSENFKTSYLIVHSTDLFLTVVNFPKNPYCNFSKNYVPYIPWYCSIMMECMKWTKVISVNWILFSVEMGNLDPSWAKIMQPYI